MFNIDQEALNANMEVNKGKFIHKPGKRIKLFPFPANDNKLKDLGQDLTSFKGIAGLCFRECRSQNTTKQLNKQEFVQNVLAKAQAPENSDLKNIINKLAFDEHGQLVVFNTSIFPHLHHYVKNETLNTIARFILHLFFDQKAKNALKSLSQKEPDNILQKLILSCLPQLEEQAPKKEPFYTMPQATFETFKEDLETLLGDQELFINGFHKLLKFYYFKYITDLILQLNAFFEQESDQLFFSLSWERLQDSRLSYMNGWKLLEKHMGTMYSHAMTLELINHLENLEEKVTYSELDKLYNQLSPEQSQQLTRTIEELTSFYQTHITDVKWDRFSPLDKPHQSPFHQAVHQLWEMVHFQFKQSSRSRAATAYQEWFKEFVKLNFTKSRGRNGYSLSLEHDDLLFLTQLCIGTNQRIRLSKLWKELERRGVFFDNISKEHAVEYFEKINLLEKKSDSGDAQYVKRLY